MPSKRSKSLPRKGALQSSLSRKRYSKCRAHQVRRSTSPRRCVNVGKPRRRSRSGRTRSHRRSRRYTRQLSVSPTRGVVDQVSRGLQMGFDPMTIMQRVKATYGENSQAINAALGSLAAAASSVGAYRYALTPDQKTKISTFLGKLPRPTQAGMRTGFEKVRDYIMGKKPLVPDATKPAVEEKPGVLLEGTLPLLNNIQQATPKEEKVV
jgi:hypothetical protein